MKDLIMKKVVEVVTKTFSLKTSMVDSHLSAGSIAEWDSFGHMALIMSLEKKFELNFEVTEIETMTNLEIIVATIEAHLNEN